MAENEEIIVRKPGLPTYALIDGEAWPPAFNAKTVRSACAYDPDADDIFINTYPKCGTTWVQQICLSLAGKTVAPGENVLIRHSPMLDFSGEEEVKKLPRPRLIKTHFRREQMKHVEKIGRLILVFRNPKDCLVSLFFHHLAFKQYEFESGEFNAFFDLFVDNPRELQYGGYYEFMDSWLPHINDQNVLTLVYEQMLTDLPGSVSRIANFLGGDFQKCAENEEKLNQVVEESTLKSMKGCDGKYFPEEILTGASPFIRKGVAKDWVNHFSEEQNRVMDELFERKLGNTICKQWWKDVMKK